jgi:hypothetical protein
MIPVGGTIYIRPTANADPRTLILGENHIGVRKAHFLDQAEHQATPFLFCRADKKSLHIHSIHNPF